MLGSCIEVENRVKFLLYAWKWHEDGKTIPLSKCIELLIPCIPRVENRVGEKILTTIFCQEFNIFKDGLPMDTVKFNHRMLQILNYKEQFYLLVKGL